MTTALITDHNGALTAESTCTVDAATVLVPVWTEQAGAAVGERVTEALKALGYAPVGDMWRTGRRARTGFTILVKRV